ncbi:hypothetical protein EBO15_10385 [Actinomadura harenae]|uniref:Uncharacterized protein n=1 Tax=Actinomadura harenae TaxID=2483351 RepID=A0A3M2M6A0_9ACTN|nr:hypothetical protein EBO15_10385 [Actinomadura harenae]
MAVLYGLVVSFVLTAVIQFISDNPVARALMASGLLSAVLLIWGVRRARDYPSYNLTGMLFIVMGLSGTLAILAIPLAPEYRVPQAAVALILPWVLIGRVGQRLLP